MDTKILHNYVGNEVAPPTIKYGSYIPVGGSNGQIQFNNSGSFGGSSSLTWDGTKLSVPIVNGGSGATSALSLVSTSGTGTTDRIDLNLGTNGSITTLSAINTGFGTYVNIPSYITLGSGGFSNLFYNTTSRSYVTCVRQDTLYSPTAYSWVVNDQTAGACRLQIDPSGQVSIYNQFYIANQSAPSTPSGGALLYTNSGVMKVLNSDASTGAIVFNSISNATIGGVQLSGGYITNCDRVFASDSSFGIYSTAGAGSQFPSLNFSSTGIIRFASTGIYYTGIDTGLARNAAGVVEINNGTAGTLADLTCRNASLSGPLVLYGGAGWVNFANEASNGLHISTSFVVNPDIFLDVSAFTTGKVRINGSIKLDNMSAPSTPSGGASLYANSGVLHSLSSAGNDVNLDDAVTKAGIQTISGEKTFTGGGTIDSGIIIDNGSGGSFRLKGGASSYLTLAYGPGNGNFSALNTGGFAVVTSQANSSGLIIQTNTASPIKIGTNETLALTIDASQNTTFSGRITTPAISVTSQALTDATTIAWNMQLGHNATVTLGGNRTLGLPTNIIASSSGVLVITQDATGSRTLAYNAVWKFSGGTAPTLSTGANKVDMLAWFSPDGTSLYGNLLVDMR